MTSCVSFVLPHAAILRLLPLRAEDSSMEAHSSMHSSSKRIANSSLSSSACSLRNRKICDIRMPMCVCVRKDEGDRDSVSCGIFGAADEQYYAQENKQKVGSSWSKRTDQREGPETLIEIGGVKRLSPRSPEGMRMSMTCLTRDVLLHRNRSVVEDPATSSPLSIALTLSESMSLVT